MATEQLTDMTDEFLRSRIRARYLKELNSEALTNDTALEYARCMVRSPRVKDMRDGLTLLRTLLSESPDDTEFRKHCYYGLAIGHVRLQEFLESYQAIENLRLIDPKDLELKKLEEAVEKKVNSEAIKGGFALGGILAVIGSAAAFAFRLLR